MNMCPEKLYLGLGRYSHYRYSIDTEISRYGHHAVPIQMMVTAAKKNTIIIESSASIISHLTFKQLNKT